MSTVVGQIDNIVEWLRASVTAAGGKGLVVGVSGGIDSAVVSALIKKAFPENSMGVLLPCHSNPQDAEDAYAVVQAVKLQHIKVNLSAAHDAILKPVSEQLSEVGLKQGNLKLADANLRARLRMSTLYTVANANNYLVVGTDNAAEVHTGYFTKYGDGGVDLLPISQFLKREIRELARALDIPQQIISKAPSAGLWEGQTDETEMGVTYKDIDDFLSGQTISEPAQARIDQLHKVSEHKRHMPPAYQRTDK
jgi:NAD+ synthase